MVIIIIRGLDIYKRVNICNNLSIVGDLYCKMFLTCSRPQAVIFLSDYLCQTAVGALVFESQRVNCNLEG